MCDNLLILQMPMSTLGAGSQLGLCHLSGERQATTLRMASWDWNLPYAWYFPTVCPHESLCLTWYGTWPRKWGRQGQL